VLYLNLEEKRLDDIALVGLVFRPIVIFGFWYLIEGKLVAAVKIVMVVVAG
jgi:hypothetical protein